MDPIIKIEVFLNVLNTTIAYAFFFNSEQLKQLQRMQYDVYHSPLSMEDLNEKTQYLISVRQEILSLNMVHV